MVRDMVEQPLDKGDVVAYAIRTGANPELRLGVVEDASEWPIRITIPVALEDIGDGKWRFSRRSKSLKGQDRVVRVSREYLALALGDPENSSERVARVASLIAIAKSMEKDLTRP